MTQEEKNLLIKDLCARLPYAVTVEHTSGFRGTLHNITVHHMYDDNDNIHDAVCYTDFFGDGDSIYIEYFKPYLFPMSSMTEEQKIEIKSLCDGTEIFDDGSWMSYISILGSFNFEINLDVVDWFNKNHFDYRGLIEKGLAIDATGKGIY